MIYDKDASFPYPVLSNTSNYYNENIFSFETNLVSTNENYVFNFHYEIGSPFLEQLFRKGTINLLFILKEEDNHFVRLDYGQNEVTFPKNRLSLNKNTKIQLQLQAIEDISFEECYDLDEFYDNFKNEIVVPKYGLLAYSDIEVYLGDSTSSIVLFEKQVDETMESAFAIEIRSEIILLKFKKAGYQLNGYTKTNSIPNMYIYAGLTRALSQFIRDNVSDDYVDLETVSKEQNNGLNQKLLDLMINKGVDSLSYESIDEVVNQISDQIIEKYVTDIREVASSES